MPDLPLAFAPDDESAWERLVRGYRTAGLVLSAHRIGLLARLAEGGRPDTTSLAADLVADQRLVHEMCRGLQAAGLVRSVDNGWDLSAAGRRLLADPAVAVELDSMAEDYQRWGRLDKIARELAVGEPPEHSAYDESLASRNVAAARRYALRLSARHREQARQLIAYLTPTRPVWVLDVAGGDGLMSREICDRWPDARCTVVEQPTMAEIAARSCRGQERIEVHAATVLPDHDGTARDPVPEGADVIVLANVLDEITPQAQRTLTAALARSLAPGGCLVSSETVLRSDEQGPLDVVLWAVGQASQHHDGHLLTTTEQNVLLRAAGLAASAEWAVGPHTRAVLGVRTAAGVEPALRVRGPRLV